MKRYYTTEEAAKILGITRQAVVLRIWTGKIRANKVGKNYIIHYSQIKKAHEDREKNKQ